MRNYMKAAAFVAMIAIPGAAFAAQATTAAPAAQKKSAAPAKAGAPAAKAVAKHTTAGVVKSSTDSSLVITKAGKDETFVVNSSTEKKGALDAGTHVTVHYTMDGKSMVATAVTAQPAKAGKSKGKK